MLRERDVLPQRTGETRTRKRTSAAVVVLSVVAGFVLFGFCGIGTLLMLEEGGLVRRGWPREPRASVALPKSLEALANLGDLADAERDICTRLVAEPDGRLAPRPLVTSAGPLPRAPSASPQRVSTLGDRGFRDLRFDLQSPVYYSYSIVPDPDTPGGAILRAVGDVDGDHALSRFEVRCSPRPSCTCTEVTITDELE